MKIGTKVKIDWTQFKEKNYTSENMIAFDKYCHEQDYFTIGDHTKDPRKGIQAAITWPDYVYVMFDKPFVSDDKKLNVMGFCVNKRHLL